jgi:hypothetical protein
MSAETREYRYPPAALRGDYLRAVTGLTVFGAPALFVPLSSVMVALLGGLGLLFGLFGARTLVRQLSTVAVDADGIRMTGPRRRGVRWREIKRVRLRYYSTWRDRTSGWMQLDLEGGGSAIRVDQALDGFDEVAKTVLSMAVARGVGMDAATRQNAGALGLDLPDGQGV